MLSRLLRGPYESHQKALKVKHRPCFGLNATLSTNANRAPSAHPPRGYRGSSGDLSCASTSFILSARVQAAAIPSQTPGGFTDLRFEKPAPRPAWRGGQTGAQPPRRWQGGAGRTPGWGWGPRDPGGYGEMARRGSDGDGDIWGGLGGPEGILSGGGSGAKGPEELGGPLRIPESRGNREGFQGWRVLRVAGARGGREPRQGQGAGSGPQEGLGGWVSRGKGEGVLGTEVCRGP